jgi:hypothetical protein
LYRIIIVHRTPPNPDKPELKIEDLLMSLRSDFFKRENVCCQRQKNPEPFPVRGKKNAMDRIRRPMALVTAILIF